MNDRIKELMAKASTIRYSGMGDTDILDPAKFAELIIRECATVASRAENSDTDIRCTYDVITEHFGVDS